MHRQAYYADQGWYPADPVRLESMINHSMPDSSPELPMNSDIKALISPHAGYIYSLKTALHAFQSIKQKSFENVFVLAPSHRSHCNNKAVLSDFKSFDTPLGSLPLNQKLITQINKSHPDHFCINNNIHIEEHAVELQLPLLYFMLEKVSIIPVILPHSDLIRLNDFGKILSEYIGSNDLLILSSDLSHFPTQKTALEIDKESMNSWVTLNTDKIWEVETKWASSKKTSCAMCGISSIISGISALNEFASDLHVFLTDHSTSFDVSEDDTHVVGYGSAIIYKCMT